MPQQLYRIVSVLKFSEEPKKEAHVFKGTLDDILYKFGAKDNNPLQGYISKGHHYVYKFFVWSGNNWIPVSDPRPETLTRKVGFSDILKPVSSDDTV